MSSVYRWFASLFLCLALAVSASEPASAAEGESAHIKARLIAASSTVAPGGDIDLALDYTSAPGWHTYWINPGDTGLAPTFTWNLPDGFAQDGDIQFPTPKRLLSYDLMSYGYEGRTVLIIPMHNAAKLTAGQALPIHAKVDFLVCADVCIPESLEVSLRLTVGQGGPGADARTIDKARPAIPVQGNKDGPAGVTIDIRDGMVELGFPFPYTPAPDSYFFLEQPDIIVPGAPQAIDMGPGGFTLRVKAATATLPAGDLTGVLVAGPGPGSRFPLDRAPLAAKVHGLGTPLQGTVNQNTSFGGVLMVALGALLGGMILNLMPCVFPVLSMKLLSLSRAGHDHRAARLEALVYGGGVLASFLVLAGLIVVARQFGAQVGWGFQLQSPFVVAALAVIMLLVALNMSGLFEVGTSLQRFGGIRIDDSRPLLSAFLTGVLAVVVAAPCTAPFMGPAIGVALTQGGLTGVVIFAALGLGFALPFVALTFLITWVPAVARALPRPGPWMDWLKRGLSLLMYAAALWLLWVFAQQVNLVGVALLVIAMALAIAAVMPLKPMPVWARPALWGVALILAIFAPGQPQATKPAAVTSGALPHQAFSVAQLTALRTAGKPVFVDLTAAWCVTCKVNEGRVLASKPFEQAMIDTGTVYMVGDWTNQDTEISHYLALYGRSGVPLYVYYGPNNAEAKVLPQLLDTNAVVKVLRGGK